MQGAVRPPVIMPSLLSYSHVNLSVFIVTMKYNEHVGRGARADPPDAGNAASGEGRVLRVEEHRQPQHLVPHRQLHVPPRG